MPFNTKTVKKLCCSNDYIRNVLQSNGEYKILSDIIKHEQYYTKPIIFPTVHVISGIYSTMEIQISNKTLDSQVIIDQKTQRICWAI